MLTEEKKAELIQLKQTIHEKLEAANRLFDEMKNEDDPISLAKVMEISKLFREAEKASMLLVRFSKFFWTTD